MQKLFRIRTLLKFESQCLETYSALKNGKDLEPFIDSMADRLNRIRQSMDDQKISINDLTPKNQAAMLTLRGILELHTNQQTKYVRIYRQCHKAIAQSSRFNDCQLVLRFRASARLNHSIKLHRRTLFLNISLISRSLPEDYFTDLTALLITRLSGRKPPRKLYHTIHVHELPLLNSQQGERVFNRKTRVSSTGRHFNLSDIFQSLNSRYFNNLIPDTNIGWSQRKSIRRLGSYNSMENLIRISKILDHPDIPAYVLEGIVYHEMLHIIHPIRQKNGRRIIHGGEFKGDEKKFTHHRKLDSWLRNEYPRFAGNIKESGKLKKLFF